MVRSYVRYNIELAKEIFADAGCLLLEEEYKHIKHPMRYKCLCGNEAQISLDRFKRGVRCRKCGIKKSSSKQRLMIEEIKEVFKDNECELLSDVYENARTPLKYKCECGEVSFITYDNLRRGVRCKDCGLEKLAETYKHSYTYIKKQFENEGCQLISNNYHNSKQILDYICVCGRPSKIAYINFMKGKRCRECGWDKIRGENHPNFNPELTDKERKRRVPGYEKWRASIIARDGNKCVKCEARDNIELNVHHILNYSSNPELAVDENNGITLCKPCHTEFHKTYGYTNNNKDQLEEWLGDKIA